MRSSHKIGIYIIKDGDLLCDTLYLNPFDDFNQWYNLHGKIREKRLSTDILTEVKVQSINDFNLTSIASNNLRSDKFC